MNNELTHWGVLGMKWGVRRYQNVDGSLTPKGQARISKYGPKMQRQQHISRYGDTMLSGEDYVKEAQKAKNTLDQNPKDKDAQKKYQKAISNYITDYNSLESNKVEERKLNAQVAVVVVASVVVTSLVRKYAGVSINSAKVKSAAKTAKPFVYKAYDAKRYGPGAMSGVTKAFTNLPAIIR